MLLHLIRHPEPQISTGVCYGVSDIPALPNALSESVASLGKQLASLNGVPLYSSPLQRCSALAQALQEILPTSTLKLCPELAELNFGSWEGLSWDSIYEKDESSLNRWAAEPTTYAPGGGESLSQLHQRVMLWLITICKTKSQQAIVITHGGPLRVLLSIKENNPSAALSIATPAWGSLTVIEITL